MTQSSLIISWLREKGEIYNWQLTEMGIQQYNARISDARDILGCIHGKRINKIMTCKATEHIISDRDNHFTYQKDKPEIMKGEIMNISWEERRQQLNAQTSGLAARVQKFYSLCDELKHNYNTAKAKACKRYGVEKFQDLNLQQINELINLLEGQKVYRKDKEDIEIINQLI
jgi:hypothetical protein